MQLNVVAAIEKLQEEAQLVTKMARVLAFARSVMLSTGTLVIHASDGSIMLRCSTPEDANKVASVYRIKLNLQYYNHSHILESKHKIVDGVYIQFTVPTIREVQMSACKIVRKKKGTSGWHVAKLMFYEREMAHTNYMPTRHPSAEGLSTRLFKIATEAEKNKNYKFVL